MRVLFYGSHLKHFNLARWLRARGHDVLLLLTRESKPSELPEWEDPTLAGRRPDWVRLETELGAPTSRTDLVPDALRDVMREEPVALSPGVKRLAADYDIVFTSARHNVLPALDFDRPIVFRAVGSDMSRLPFECGSPLQEFRSYYFRRNIHRVAAILAYQEDTYWSARLLGVENRIEWFSIPTDVDALARNTNESLLAELNERYRGARLVLFSPARHEMDDRLPRYKGTEKLLAAFRRLHSEVDGLRLVMVAAGADLERSRALTREYGLEAAVEFVGGARDDYRYLPLHDLTAYMRIDNAVVINDVGYHKWHLTGCAREALSVGAVLVDGVRRDAPEFLRLYGPDCPLAEAVSVEEIHAAVKPLVDGGPAALRERREASLRWARRFLHWEARIDELMAILEARAEGLRAPCEREGSALS